MADSQIGVSELRIQLPEKPKNPFSEPVFFLDKCSGNAIETSIHPLCEQYSPQAVYSSGTQIDLPTFRKEISDKIKARYSWNDLADITGTNKLSYARALPGKEEELKQYLYRNQYFDMLEIPDIELNTPEWIALKNMFTEGGTSLIKSVKEFRYLFPKGFWWAHGGCGPASNEFENLLLKRGIISLEDIFKSKTAGVEMFNWGDEVHAYNRIGNIGIDWTRAQIDGSDDYPYVFRLGTEKGKFYAPQIGRLNSYPPNY